MTARWSAWGHADVLIQEADTRQRGFPKEFALDLRTILNEYENMRHLLGGSALQPLMVLYTATSLHDSKSQTRSTRNLYLMALSVRRLLSKPQRLAQKRDALLTAIFAFHPKYEQDPRIVADFQRQMKLLRTDPNAEARLQARMNDRLQEGRDELEPF